MDGASRFLQLREQLGSDAPATVPSPGAIAWPPGLAFNWALDYFDRMAAGNDRLALRVIDDDGHDAGLSFAALAHRSSQVANFLAELGVGRGDRVLIMLGNVVALW
jgi:acetyl-CoA synthetase